MRKLLLLIATLIGALVLPAGAADGSALVEAGFPALSREWLGDDYMRAAQLLASGKVPVPQMTDEDGRLFIQRLTSTENLAFYRNRSLPIQQRMESFFNLLGGISAIAKQYMVAANNKSAVHRELTLEMGFMLRASVAGIQLIDEFLPTMPKDEQYPARMAGLKKAYGGLTSVFAGAETSLTETTFYTADDLSLLLQAMAESIPEFKRIFAPDYKIELRQKLERHRSDFTRPEDVQRIQRMVDELGS